MVTKTVEQLSNRADITDAQLHELNALHRLPKISEATASKLLGPLADRIPTPASLPQFAAPCPAGWHAASNRELKQAKRQAKAAATSTTEPPTTAPPTTEPPTTEPPTKVAPDDADSTDDADATTTVPTPTTTTRAPVVVLGGCAKDA
jgi:hypothetical protein